MFLGMDATRLASCQGEFSDEAKLSDYKDECARLATLDRSLETPVP